MTKTSTVKMTFGGGGGFVGGGGGFVGGGGRELYTRLLRRLTERGYRQAFAGITQPNEASNSFHRSFGFQDAGLYRRVEWKHDGWHDVAWMQLDLLGAVDQDRPPGPIV